MKNVKQGDPELVHANGNYSTEAKREKKCLLIFFSIYGLQSTLKFL